MRKRGQIRYAVMARGASPHAQSGQWWPWPWPLVHVLQESGVARDHGLGGGDRCSWTSVAHVCA